MGLTRPKLQGRAITEMGPLKNPQRDTSNSSRDLGQGTRSATGGANLTGGSRLPNGSFAPVSPFLPLPPPPSAAELKANAEEYGSRTPRPNDDENSAPSPAFPARSTAMGGSKSRTGSLRSQGMVRSFSTPVATQKEYEAQCKTFARRQAHGSSQGQPLQWSRGWPASTSSAGPWPSRPFQRRVASDGNPRAMQPSMSQQPPTTTKTSDSSSSRKSAKPTSVLSPLCVNTFALSPLESQSNSNNQSRGGTDGYFFSSCPSDADSPSPESTSGSDYEPITPKADLPRDAAFAEAASLDRLTAAAPVSFPYDKYEPRHLEHQGDFADEMDMTLPDDGFDMLIHPGHLQPPPISS
ncbi:unnamed protein product [Jaminaea pallidilutea]